MNELVRIAAQTTLPALITAAGEPRLPFLEFFAANIRNPHTRRAYSRAIAEDGHARFDNGSDYRPNGLEHSAFPNPRLKDDPFDLIERHVVGTPVIELRRARAGMVRHQRRIFQRAAELAKHRDPGRAE